jgi:hypothetical protein
MFFGFLLDALFYLLSSIFQDILTIVDLMVESTRDEGLPHQFLHLRGEVSLAMIL